MKTPLLCWVLTLISIFLWAQVPKDESVELSGEEAQEILAQLKKSPEEVLQIFTDEVCQCIDSLVQFNTNQEINSESISKCISKQVLLYQTFSMLNNTLDSNEEVTLSVNDNPDSDQYQKYYKELENGVTENCRNKLSSATADNIVYKNSMSENDKALKYYGEAVDLMKVEQYKKAIPLFKKAVKEDPNFAFAWDNLGLCYRRTQQLDKAIAAYEKSIAIEPNGEFPLQNMAVVYEYKSDFEKAIEYYSKLDKLNPERYYGMGRNYVVLGNFEKGLDNLCKAYNLYKDMNSPYQIDAEKMIQITYNQMQKKGQTDIFYEILEKNNINVDKE